MHPNERYWTADEVAAVLRVSHRTITRWVANGAIQAIQLPGGQLRIPQSEVDRLQLPTASSDASTQSGAA